MYSILTKFKELLHKFIVFHLSQGYIESLSSPLWLTSTSIRPMLAKALDLSVWGQSNSPWGARISLEMASCLCACRQVNMGAAPVAKQTDGFQWIVKASVCLLEDSLWTHPAQDNHMEACYMFGSGKDKGNQLFQCPLCFSFISHLLGFDANAR